MNVISPERLSEQPCPECGCLPSDPWRCECTNPDCPCSGEEEGDAEPVDAQEGARDDRCNATAAPGDDLALRPVRGREGRRVPHARLPFWMLSAPEAPLRAIFTPNMDAIRELTFDEDEEQVTNAWVARAVDILRAIEAEELVIPEGPWLRRSQEG